MTDRTADAMGQALRQMTGRYEALVRVFSILHQTEGLDGARMQLDEACTSLLEIIGREMQSENCSFMLLDPRSQRLTLKAAASPLQSRGYFIESDVWQGKCFRLGEGVAGRVAQLGDPIRIEDPGQCGFFAELPGSPVRIGSLLCLPLVVGDGQVLGVLNLSHSRNAYFTLDVERAMTLVARQAARVLSGPVMLYLAREGKLHTSGVARATPDGLVVFSPEGRTLSATPGIELLTGYAPEHWCGGASWRDRVTEKDRARFDAHRAAVLDGHTRSRVEYRFSRGDRRVMVMAETASPLYCGATHGTTIAAALREAESVPLGSLDRLHAEAHLLRHQRILALGQLADGVSEQLDADLKAVLRGLQAPVLGVLDDVNRALLEEAREAASRATHLVNGLRTFSYAKEPAIERMDATGLLVQIGATLRESFDKTITIHTEVEAGPLAIMADRNLLRVAILNICLNAEDALRAPEHIASNGARRIVLGLEPVSEDRIRSSGVTVSEPGAFVRIYVTDTGPGIDRDCLEHVFEPFYTTKPARQGAGLGLTTVHAIARQLGGSVEVRSEPGVGTTFALFIPAANDKKPPSPDDGGKGVTVLLVDDEDLVLRVGKAMLERLGYTVMTATSGKDALASYEATEPDIAAIICDENMPDMRGSEVLRRLRAGKSDVRFVLTSGNYVGGDFGAEPHASAEEPTAWLQKPYRIGEMADLLRDVLG